MVNIKDQNRSDYGDVVTDTQRSSWDETQTKMGVQDSKVLEAIKNTSGLANFEICSLVHRPPHGVSGSLTRLRESSLIEDTGSRKVNPNSRKGQIVWRASVRHLGKHGQIEFF